MIVVELMIKVLCYAAIAFAVAGLLLKFISTTTESEYDRQA